MIRPALIYVTAYHETGSAAGAALQLGCSRRVVYKHLRRAGVPVRRWRRRVLRLVTAQDPLRDWQRARLHAIDVELGRLRAEWARLLGQATQTKGPARP